MIYANISIYLVLLTILLSSITMVFCHIQIHKRSAYQFRSLSNLLDAMLQGDYTLRAYSGDDDIALKELILAINALAERLNKQRMESIESQLLLQTVINHIDVAIVALDEESNVVFYNPAAQKLLKVDEDLILEEKTDQQLNQLSTLQSGKSSVMSLMFSGQQGKFNVHLEEFREEGKQHKLLFITDVSTMLRTEERNAWKNLVRVLSHEINNSLSPIASISQTLKRFLAKHEDIQGHKDNLIEGLGIIAQRSNNLKEFVNSYKQIARLPAPEKKLTSIKSLIRKVSGLFHKNNITMENEEDIELNIDPVQIEQVLINLLKNADEAMKDNDSVGNIVIDWQRTHNTFVLTVRDEGTGITNTDNLFVPFYTTKQQGSGIGLVLCRQILEVHNGTLSLENRTKKKGCKATIELLLG